MATCSTAKNLNELTDAERLVEASGKPLFAHSEVVDIATRRHGNHRDAGDCLDKVEAGACRHLNVGQHHIDVTPTDSLTQSVDVAAHYGIGARFTEHRLSELHL